MIARIAVFGWLWQPWSSDSFRGYPRLKAGEETDRLRSRAGKADPPPRRIGVQTRVRYRRVSVATTKPPKCSCNTLAAGLAGEVKRLWRASKTRPCVAV